MARLFNYKLIVKGPKNACYAFWASTPGLEGTPWIVKESGTPNAYAICMHGLWLTRLDEYAADVDMDWSGATPVSLPEDPQQAYNEAKKLYSRYLIDSRAAMFHVDVQIVTHEEDTSEEYYDHYRFDKQIRYMEYDDGVYFNESLLTEPNPWSADLTFKRKKKVKKTVPADLLQEIAGTVSDPKDFQVKNGVLKKYTGTAEHVIVPDGVISLGERVFKSAPMRSVQLPDGLCTIEKSAFTGCTALAEISIPDSVSEIKSRAFYECISLTTVKLPKQLKAIEKEAFAGCANLQSIPLPETLEHIGERAFYKDLKLEQICLPQGLKQLDVSAFNACKSLKRIVLPESLSTIGTRIFYDCKKLQDVVLPANLQMLPERFLAHCDSLQTVTLPETLTEIGGAAFKGCKALCRIRIPKSVRLIGYSAFENCGNLADLRFDSTVRGQIRIGEAAFEGCHSLSEDILQQIEAAGDVEAWLDSIDVSAGLSLAEAKKLFVLERRDDHMLLLRYLGTKTDVILPPHIDGIPLREIGPGAFMSKNFWENGIVTSVVIPEGVTIIGQQAFAKCTNLTRVVMPDSLVCIGANAFLDCVNLTDIRLPPKLERIGACAFSECENMPKVTLPDTLEFIGPQAFRHCAGLADENGTITIGTRVVGCRKGTKILVIPPHATEIEEEAFIRSTLVEAHIPVGIKKIGQRAFYGCSALHKVSIPQGVKKIDRETFAFSSLNEITLPNSVTNVAFSAFYGCFFQRIVLPSSVGTVGEWAFRSCPCLTEVVFENPNVRLHPDAFWECTHLSPQTAAKIEERFKARFKNDIVINP